MSSISVRLEEDTDQLLERLKNIQNVDKAGIMNAIAEGLRTVSYTHLTLPTILRV